MFGTYRLALAMLVVYAHTVPWVAGQWNWAGIFAVYTFFVLSGYLMTLVLQRTYGFTGRGTARFFANRALRIYPPYLAAVALSAVLLIVLPEASAILNGDLELPATLLHWTKNLLLFGLSFGGDPLWGLVPIAWSLHVELCFYVMMGLVLSGSRATVGLWLVGSLAYTVYLVATDAPFIARYSNVPAGSLAFSVGAAIYFARERWSAPDWLAAPVLLLFFANALGAGFALDTHDLQLHAFYLQLVLGALAVYALAGREAEPESRLARLDAQLGDLSYPVFLFHFAVTVVVLAAMGARRLPVDGSLFPPVAVISLLLGWGVHRGIEQPVERIRRSLRSSGG